MTGLTDLQKKISALLPHVELRFEEPMQKHTSFRIGGNVEVMVFPQKYGRVGGNFKNVRFVGLQSCYLRCRNQYSGTG